MLAAYFCFLLQLFSWVCVILWALVFFVSTSAQSGNLLFPLCTKETGGGSTRVHFCYHRNPWVASVGCGSELVSSLPSSDVYFGEGMSYLFTSDTQGWSQFRPSVCIWPIAHFSCSVYAWFVWLGVLSWYWFLWWHLTATPRLLRSLFVCHWILWSDQPVIATF